MIIAPSLRQLMADHNSLREYAEGRLVTFDVVKRRLFLAEREQDTRLPDHHYKRGRDEAFGNEIKSLPDLLTKGLSILAEKHLEFVGRRLYVRTSAFGEWQDLVTFCAPMPVLAALIRSRFERGMRSPADLGAFMKDSIAPNVQYTCLPSPRFPEMEQFLSEGFHDLHAHINHTVETDFAWQFFLKEPVKVAGEMRKGIIGKGKDKAKEQWETECPGLDGPRFLRELLFTAIRLRRAFVHVLFDGVYSPELCDAFKGLSTAEISKNGSHADQMLAISLRHPMERVFGRDEKGRSYWSEECLEALMHVLVADRLEATKDEALAAFYHHYLLILGLVNRFVVQQVRQTGFDQFQKVTVNEFRSVPEETFAKRFFQLHGNELKNLRVLEGRFSPKSTVTEMMESFDAILKGWETFKWKSFRCCGRVPELRLVCHFIKSEDRRKLECANRRAIRHSKLRHELWQKAWALVGAWENYPKVWPLLAGVDAASNELEAPPEVFAPVFRFLRRRGVKHFTYHAGEDFHHLVGGLRAMWEAVEFLDFRRGDRLGHGTAAGIPPELWLDHVGEEMVVSQGEWLDDMIFAFHLIIENSSERLERSMSRLRSRIAEYSRLVYGETFTVDELLEAWKLRRHCPGHLLACERDEVPTALWNEEEWRERCALRPSMETMRLVNLYHREDARKRYHIKKRLEVTDVFDKEDLLELQKLVLAHLHKKEVVIETLPTSNVRISFYKDHNKHHLWRWLKIEKNGEKDFFDKVPPLVTGTDDSGIFATNIFNEYSHMYDTLTRVKGKDYAQARAVVELFERNAKTYAFTPGKLSR